MEKIESNREELLHARCPTESDGVRENGNVGAIKTALSIRYTWIEHRQKSPHERGTLENGTDSDQR